MEELQDALEDAQYVNAINVEEGPRPITAWENPSEEALEEWKAKLIQEWETNQQANNNNNNGASSPLSTTSNSNSNGNHSSSKRKSNSSSSQKLKPFDFEWTLSSTLGLFLFSSYVKEESGDYVRMCFIEEVLRWRCLRGRSKGMKLRKIFERYLTPCDSEVDDETKEVKKILPAMTVIDELDMAYTSRGEKLSTSALKEIMEVNVKEDTEACCIGVEGPLRDKVIEPIEHALLSVVQQKDGDSSQSGANAGNSPSKPHNMPDFSSVPDEVVVSEETKTQENDGDATASANPTSDQNSEQAPEAYRKIFTGSRSAALAKIADDLFDELEQVILECIRQKHWEGFAKKGNPYWDKLLNFLWHKDRPPVEEDFFLMRVLGRGGFGLVTGELLQSFLFF